MAKNQLAIVILAAGQGTRMKSAKPKVMHELAGLPMMKWLIKTAESLKPQKIIVVAGPGMPELLAAVKPHTAVIQETRNGTAGALRMAMPALKNFKGDVLVVLGDAPLVKKETLEKLVTLRRSEDAGMSVLGAEVCCADGLGRLIIDSSNTLKKIVEHKDANTKERAVNLINTGAFCIDGEKLPGWLEQVQDKNAAKEYYITDLPQIAARDGIETKVHTACCASETQGCNSRADLAALEATMQKRLRKAAMESGVTMIDPATVTLHHDTVFGADVVIEPNVFFGPGASVGADCIIRAFSHIEGAKIGAGATIGPFARLRPGTEIGADVRVGNFVEIKKSKIGTGSKINHLAYVGDTDMGADVNFSAGAITVNYDGFDKHKTIIGAGVMVGSNVNLIAPVTVRDGAFVAAGSTVTDDVAADALAIARAATEIRKGWAAEYRRGKKKDQKKKGKKK
ncbi:MAG: bifunctional UDP-N-acetylglucosamine diphosphorylase/glucosamine-1-phosphate N-acetyltransferase GlmU [Alphaproteobacteria bacterium]